MMVVGDASVALHPSELVITEEGRLDLTDCATNGGTWTISAGHSASGWQRVRQGFVRADQPLRLGDHQCTAGDLPRWSRGAPADASAGGGAWDGGAQHRVRGPVARGTSTCEIVRRRP